MEWGELARSFSLGNAAILTNVCMLPLYPGLIAFLTSSITEEGTPSWITKWLGIVVLAGILTMMVIIGFILYSLSLVTEDIVEWLLPLIYFTVIALGIALFMGKSPFAKLSTVETPVISNPFVMAYVYGLLLAPMTIPCTGAFLFAQFVLGAGSIGSLTESILYIIAFGVGFGWPLVVLPFFASAAQRNFTRWLAKNHLLLNRASGVLLVLIGIFGIVYEVIPNVA